MPPFPKTYQVVRGGSFETVVVGDVEALLDLRTELELVLQLGAGATPEMVAALDARLGQLASLEPGEAMTEFANVLDIRSVLTDAMAPANSLAAASIDANYPEIKGVLNMSAVKKESKKFKKEVAEAIGDAPVDDVDALANAFADATEEATLTAKTSQADGAEPAAEAEDIIIGEQQVEIVADALEGLAAEAENELEAITNGFEEAADELVGMGLTTQDTVCEAENPSDENQDTMSDVATTEPNIAEPVSEDTYIDDPFEELALAIEENNAGMFGLDEGTSRENNQKAIDPFASTGAETVDVPTQAVGVVDSAKTITMPVTQTYSASVQSSQDCGGLRDRLEEIKQNLISQIDRLAEVLDEVSNVQEQVCQAASQAAKFRQAADQAQTASQQLAAIQAEANQARSQCKQAENRVAEAHREWEAAQRAAAEAAQRIEAIT